MAIWYYHWFLVDDLAWQGDKRHAEAIHQTLVRWKLVSGKPTLTDPSLGKARGVNGKKIEASGRLPDNLVMSYPNAGLPVTRRLLGPAEWEEDGLDEETEVCIEGVHVVLGSDFKVFASDYCGEVHTVTRPPLRRSKAVVPRPPKASTLGTLSYPADDETRPPEVALASAHAPPHFDPAFKGVWRSGVMFDCYKYVPLFVNTGDLRLPERALVVDLEAALETKLVEVGLFG